MRLLGMSTVAVIALALAGCDVPPEQRSRDVCTAYCGCIESGNSAVAECVDECIPEIPVVSDDCLTCVYENSQMCGSLLDDCTDICDPQQPTPRLGGMQ